jgi:hypothetical protein
MTRKNTLQKKKSRTLTRALAVLAVVSGTGLISAAPAHADHWHHHGGVGFFFGLPFLVPVPVPVPVYGAPYYGPSVSYDEPGGYYEDPPDEQPYYDEGHWRHEDGWDRRDERGEWTNERQYDRDRNDD